MIDIIHTRILQKSLPKGTIERKKLFRILKDNLKKSLTLICAPAGYGKTTLIADFITKEEIRFSWVHIQKDMDNFYSFITYIAHSLQKLNPDFGKSTLALIEDYRERFGPAKNLSHTINDILTVLINEFLRSFEYDVTIVIDDLSNIKSSEWLIKCFNMIFENIPTNMHFVITSREVPDFNLNILKAKRSLYLISSEDLSFSYEETEELLKNTYGLNASPAEARMLKDYLSGWITGLHLIIQSSEGEFSSLQLEKMIIIEDIYNYFTEDIFNHLETGTRNFLLCTSLLESFTAELTDYIFKSRKTGKIINELLHKNIFIQVDASLSEKDSTYYRYHTLFRKFLNTKLKDSLDDDETKAVLEKSAEFYLGKKDYTNAIDYLLRSGNQAKAAELLEENFTKFFAEGHYERLWNWFMKIPPERIETSPAMSFYKAMLLRMYKGNMDDSFKYVDKAIELSKKMHNSEILLKATIYKSRNLISTGKIQESIINLRSLNTRNLKHENLAMLNFTAAYAHYQNGDYDKALDILDKATEELENDTSGEKQLTRLSIFNLYGHIHLIRGDYAKSMAYYENVIKKSKRVIDKFETYCNLILLSAQSGKFEKALEYVNETKVIADTISIPIFRITFLLAVQSVHFEFGDYEGSISLLNEINKTAIDINHKYYVFLSYSLIGDSYYYLNKLSRAEEFYDLAFKYVNDNSEPERIQYSVTKALLLKKDRPQDDIGEVLLNAYEYYKSNRFSYNRAQSAFHLADFYYKTKNYNTALLYLSESVDTAREKEYISFLQRDFSDLRYLFDFAVANNLQKDFVKLLMKLHTEKTEASWISQDAKLRFNDTMHLNYDIQLMAFGKGEIIIRGTQIDDNFWTKKKWKAVFIYLLLNGRKQLSKDKIIDVFYPDTPIESAENIFHQMVSKFRSVIKSQPGEIPKGKQKPKKEAGKIPLLSQLIIYEDKVLRINDDFIFYADCTEFEKLYKKIPTAGNPEKKLEILRAGANLYKGDFLEGNYDTWAEELRTKYLSYFIELSEELIEILFRHEKYEQVLEYSDKLNRFDKFNLKAHEYSLRSLEALNKHKRAREQYSRLSKLYEKEYGETLPQSFMAKVKSIL